MPSRADTTAAGGALPSLTDLMGLPGVQEVTSFSDGITVAFPEADFVITMSSRRADPPCETDWEVIVREATPGLSTWWGRWHRSFSVHRSAVGPLIADEVLGAMSRVQSMLEDHARGAREIPLQEA